MSGSEAEHDGIEQKLPRLRDLCLNGPRVDLPMQETVDTYLVPNLNWLLRKSQTEMFAPRSGALVRGGMGARARILPAPSISALARLGH